MRTTEDLKQAVHTLVPRERANKYYAQLFQALRIEVNDEVGALKSMLSQLPELIKPGGRLAVLSYHSLEDRPVKHLIQRGNPEGELDPDAYGHSYRPFVPISRGVLRPSAQELQDNPRARSARLRLAERQPLDAR